MVYYYYITIIIILCAHKIIFFNYVEFKSFVAFVDFIIIRHVCSAHKKRATKREIFSITCFS